MGGFTGIRFEAPDPEPAPKPGEQVDTQPRPGASRTPGAGKGGDEGKDDRYEDLQRELEELRGSNRQLIDLVGRQTPAPRKEETVDDDPLAGFDFGTDPADETEDDVLEDPAAIVEDLSKLGTQALAKRGFMRKADVLKLVRSESRKAAATASTQAVARAKTEVSQQNVVMREFPELADPESDLFKETAARVRRAIAIDPKAANSPATLYIAAEAAKAELERKGEGNGGGKRKVVRDGSRGDDFDEVDDFDDEDREPVARQPRQRQTENDRRIAAQQGDRGRSGRSRIQSDDDGVVMTAEAKDVARMMGLSDDEYKTEATRVRRTAGAARRR